MHPRVLFWLSDAQKHGRNRYVAIDSRHLFRHFCAGFATRGAARTTTQMDPNKGGPLSDFRPTMRVLVALFCVMALALVATGCGDDPNAPEANSNEPEKQRSAEDLKNEAENFEEPPPVQILSGIDTGVRPSGNAEVIVARSSSEMKAMLKEHFSNGVDKQPVPETDYKTRQIVGVFGSKQKVGSVLTVTDVYPDKGGKTFTVEAIMLVPPKGCKYKGATKTSVRPFNVVESRAMEGEPKLVFKKQTASAC